jgi:plastocyanin
MGCVNRAARLGLSLDAGNENHYHYRTPNIRETPMKQALNFLLLPFCVTFVVHAAGFAITHAEAAEDAIHLAIKDHRFDPALLEVPAGKKFNLLVKNLDATPEEFESHDLKREKVIAGNGQAKISIGPLKPGIYKFVGEYHESTAQGQLVAK